MRTTPDHWRQRMTQLSAGDAASALTDRLHLRPGTLADYDALAEFHYLHRRPATASRVLVLEDEQRTPAARFARAPRPERQIVGVLVESLPRLASTMRDVALRGRYDGLKDGAYRLGRLVNADLRCISRVVVHPQWRGLGLAVRLVRQALATMTTPYTEAMAAMGRVHPFFELAGMRAYPRWPSPRDQRLRDALQWASVELWELASLPRMRQRIAEEHTGLLRRELRRWAGRGCGSLDAQLDTARRQLLCEPVYYLAAREDIAAPPRAATVRERTDAKP